MQDSMGISRLYTVNHHLAGEICPESRGSKHVLADEQRHVMVLSKSVHFGADMGNY